MRFFELLLAEGFRWPIGFALLASGCDMRALASPATMTMTMPTRPALQLDLRAPTADKPQLKLWFAHDTWRALLPVRRARDIARRWRGNDRCVVGAIGGGVASLPGNPLLDLKKRK